MKINFGDEDEIVYDSEDHEDRREELREALAAINTVDPETLHGTNMVLRIKHIILEEMRQMGDGVPHRSTI